MSKMKNHKSCIAISKANERLCRLRRMVPMWEEQIRQAKEDISCCILHGLVESDYVPFEEYSFGTAIARLVEARFMVNTIGQEIRLLKKQISLENKKYSLSTCQ